MTNKEAAYILSDNCCDYSTEELRTAFALAIKALEDRPKGEWIGGEIGHCSICGSEGCASDIWNGCKDGMYCPNCGADMRGDKQ